MSSVKATGASFENIRSEGSNTLKFQLVNTNVTYANTLRRTILSEVPSVGFRAEILKNGTTSDVVVTRNTTAMSNEMFAHRVGLILVHANPHTWDPEKYVFELNVENNTDKCLDVWVSDIVVSERRDDEFVKVPNTTFFHPDPITHDTCLLAVLKPKVGNAPPEAIAFKAKATVGIGRENVRFTPTSQCSYSYTPDEDPENIKAIFTSWLDRHKKISYIELENDSERKKLYEREFNTMEIARCYKKNSKGEANSFDFTIETAGAFKPIDIVIEALKALEKKCYAYTSVDKELPENVKIQSTKKEAQGFDIYFQNEDHTLGNLFTTWMDEHYLDPSGLNEELITYCGYCIPHPLRDEMLMTIFAKSDLVCRKALVAAATATTRMFGAWRENLGNKR